MPCASEQCLYIYIYIKIQCHISHRSLLFLPNFLFGSSTCYEMFLKLAKLPRHILMTWSIIHLYFPKKYCMPYLGVHVELLYMVMSSILCIFSDLARKRLAQPAGMQWSIQTDPLSCFYLTELVLWTLSLLFFFYPFWWGVEVRRKYVIVRNENVWFQFVMQVRKDDSRNLFLLV